jgi:uncharacterized protein involved in exopolysaccharide biosynthesis
LKLFLTKKNLKLFSNPRFLKTLAIGVVVTGTLTWLVTTSVFITPLYRSEALIYVPLTIPSKQIEQQGIGFASDIEIDGHIQIFQSGRMRDSLISRYNLAEKFGIDMSETGGLSRLYEKIDSRIKYEKTKFSSVSVTVLDPDPEKAAEMANAIVKLGDIIKEDILYENRRKAFMQAQLHYENKLYSVEELESQIDSLETVTGENKNNSELTRLKSEYAIEMRELASRKNHLETVERDFKTELPQAYVISEAIPAATPAWPRRKLIAAASVIAYAFLLLVFEIVKQDVKSEK